DECGSVSPSWLRRVPSRHRSPCPHGSPRRPAARCGLKLKPPPHEDRVDDRAEHEAFHEQPLWTEHDDERRQAQQITGLVKRPTRGATDESAYTPGSVPATPWRDRRRPSISTCRRRQALAAYPQTRAGHPQASAQATALRQEALLALLRVGFTEPSRS